MSDRPGRVTERTVDGVLELSLDGDQFVLEHARELVQIVFESGDNTPRDMVMVLEGVNYINSSGMSVLIRMNVERHLVIVGMAPAVKEILDLSGVLPFLTVVPDRDAARAKLRGA
ncbi:MAG: STAS domain-containing protein [Planctomycetota bacterium]